MSNRFTREEFEILRRFLRAAEEGEDSPPAKRRKVSSRKRKRARSPPPPSPDIENQSPDPDGEGMDESHVIEDVGETSEAEEVTDIFEGIGTVEEVVGKVEAAASQSGFSPQFDLEAIRKIKRKSPAYVKEIRIDPRAWAEIKKNPEVLGRTRGDMKTARVLRSLLNFQLRMAKMESVEERERALAASIAMTAMALQSVVEDLQNDQKEAVGLLPSIEMDAKVISDSRVIQVIEERKLKSHNTKASARMSKKKKSNRDRAQFSPYANETDGASEQQSSTRGGGRDRNSQRGQGRGRRPSPSQE